MIRKALFSPWMILIGLLALIALSYGALASKLGFYWDDWTIVWYIHFLGPSSFKAAFASDRPLLAWIYMLTTPLLGESPLSWQIFAMATRWLACVALWLALRGLWPRKPVQTASVAILFALYPGFKQQYIAITYGNVFVILAIYLASWALMIWSLRRPRWFWPLYLASLILSGYSVFTAEHFFGLELLRPLFLWIVLKDLAAGIQKKAPDWRRLGLLWVPYLLIDLAFLAWRISNPTPRAEITLFNDLKTSLFPTLLRLAQTAFRDVFTSSALAWKQVLSFDWLTAYPTPVLLKYLMIVLGAAVITGIVLLVAKNPADAAQPGDSRRKWAFQAIGFGLFAMFAAGIPIWPTNLRLGLDFPWDRFTLPMMFGAALLVVGLVDCFKFRNLIYVVLVALLAGLAAGMHYQNALSFRADWLAQRDFFWQLAWRAPGIEPGTILLTSEMPFAYDWDNSLTAPLNWTYASGLQDGKLPYLMYNAESRLSSGLPDLETTTQINEYLRIAPFSGSISQTVLAFYRPPGSCVKVIDPQLDQNLPNKPRYFRDIYTFSHLNLIQPKAQPAAKPPLQFFGPEPEHDWCFYFEKAELARQSKAWEEIASLGDQAFQQDKGFFRKNAYELLPFIEGYARSGDWVKSYDLTRQAYHAWPNMQLSLCNLWGILEKDGAIDGEGRPIFENVQRTLNCQEPTQ